MAHALSFENVSVEYPGVKALDGVSFSLGSHQVQGLMGENGAGKSTLLKVLAGALLPSAGALHLQGQRICLRSPARALGAGIAVIHQELNLVPELTVAENLLLGHLPARFGFVAQSALQERARQVLAELGEDLDPTASVSSLSLGQQQMVEIGKALLRNARILAFDEPTSALSVRETENLFRIVRQLKAQGCGILYVTHRMEEIFQLCDVVTVLRDGRCVAREQSVHAMSPARLVQDMVGRPIDDVYAYRKRALGDTVLKVAGLTGPGLKGPADFSLRQGEVLGFFGLVGAGRSELMRILCGIERRTAGSITCKGSSVEFASPRAAVRSGIAFLPEDRKREGIFPLASVANNINISARRRCAHAHVWINASEEARIANYYIDRLRIKIPHRDASIALLSGGNQQKALIARWLAEDIDILVLDEPTRGVDIGARADIYTLLYDLAEAGKSVIVVSSDLSEVLSISDRIIVMREGTLVASVDRDSANQESLLAMALP